MAGFNDELEAQMKNTGVGRLLNNRMNYQKVLYGGKYVEFDKSNPTPFVQTKNSTSSVSLAFLQNCLRWFEDPTFDTIVWNILFDEDPCGLFAPETIIYNGKEQDNLNSALSYLKRTGETSR